MDAREYQVSGLIGANFDDGRGNVAVSVDYSNRQSLGKLQRKFSQQATSTTPTPPMGRLVLGAGNPATQAAIDAVFATYGVPATATPRSGSRILQHRWDVFGGGVFN